MGNGNGSAWPFDKLRASGFGVIPNKKSPLVLSLSVAKHSRRLNHARTTSAERADNA